MGRKRKHEVLPPKYTANRVDQGGLLCPNHTRRLDNLAGIGSEMARVYRATINGLISTSDGARLIYQLKEIRACREAVNAEAAMALANAPPPEATPLAINILTVPSGHFLTAEQAAAGYKWEGEVTTVEHERLEYQPQPEPAPEPEPRLAALEAELNNMSLEQLMERARQCGLDPSLLSSSSSTSVD